jgi:vitamin B12 transporter
MLSSLFLLLGIFNAQVHAEPSRPRILVKDSPLSEEFSERTVTAPFAQLTPQPLQLTSPYFENLFYKSTSMQVRSSGSPTTSIRGSGQAGRVLFVLDNIPLNFSDGFGGSQLFVPTEILSHINIFEGPSSATYGNSAMGGSIHFVPRTAPRPFVRLGTSTAHIANIALIAPILNNEKNQVQASAFLDSDAGDYHYDDENQNRKHQKNNSQKLQRYTLLGRHKFGRWKISEFFLRTKSIKRTPGPTFSPSITDQESNATLAALASHFQASSSSIWNSRLSISELESTSVDQYGPSNSTSKKYWINQNYSWELSPGLLSQTTVELNHNEFKASYVNDETYRRNEPEVAQGFTIPLNKNLLVEPIARYLGKYKKTLFQVNIPYEWENAKVWVMYAEGFRPPSLIDLYATTPYYFGNKDLQPETSRQWEAGMAWHTEHISVKSSLFSTQYQNLLQSSTLNGRPSKANIGNAHTYGTSHSINLQYFPWLWEMSFSQLLARDRGTNKALKFSPTYQFFTALSFATQKWTFTIQETLWDKFQDTNFLTAQDVTIADWQSTDVLAAFKASNKLGFNFGIYNLFDKRRELSFGYPEPQRRFAAALEYSF